MTDPTLITLARELSSLCVNFVPEFRLIGNMRCDDIAKVASEMLRLSGENAVLREALDTSAADVHDLRIALRDAITVMGAPAASMRQPDEHMLFLVRGPLVRLP